MLPGSACRHVAPAVALAMAARSVPAGPLFLPYRPLADRDRDPSGRQARPAAGDRPRHGRGDRRDRGNRRRLLPVSSGHPRGRPHQRRQAAPDRWQQRDHRRRREGAGTDQGGRQRPGRLQRRRARQRARQHHRGGHPGPAGRSRADARPQCAGLRSLRHPVRRQPRSAAARPRPDALRAGRTGGAGAAAGRGADAPAPGGGGVGGAALHPRPLRGDGDGRSGHPPDAGLRVRTDLPGRDRGAAETQPGLSGAAVRQAAARRAGGFGARPGRRLSAGPSVRRDDHRRHHRRGR